MIPLKFDCDERFWSFVFLLWHFLSYDFHDNYFIFQKFNQ